jgi:8-O-methyltransferase
MPTDTAPVADPILDLVLAGLKSTILRTALDLQVWAKIGAGPRSAAAIAQSEGWNATGVRKLLDALCAMGLLGKDAQGYRLVPVAECYLLPGQPTDMGGLVLSLLPWNDYRPLADALRTGNRPIQDLTAPAATSHWIGWLAPRRVDPFRDLETITARWDQLEVTPRAGLRVLDVACGAATHTLALARRHSGVRLWLQDWPAVLDGTRAIADRLGVGRQLEFLPGNARTVDFGREQFDVAWLGHLLHYFGPDEVVAVLRRIHQALVPGGVLLLHEDVADEGRSEREYAMLEALWLYAVSAAGDVYPFSELARFLEQAGFANVKTVCELGRPGEQILRAVKP